MPDRITTDSGIPVKTSYDDRDVSRGMVRSLGKPGEFPYARGIYPSMYRDRLWTMRQYTGFGSASETNRRFKYLISHGETGLSTAFDLPTQLGLDSDHPRAHGEVGKVGVAISSIDDFAPRLSFFFACRNDFLEEIAKFRAARKIWASIMRLRFKAHDPESCKLRFHAQTSGETLTAQQPDNNIARVSIQALAAVLGGTQSLHTNSRDEALGLPTEDSVRIALRTQQIIAHESGVSRTADPLGGSYYLESLTRTIETQVAALIERVQQLGGARKAIESGFVHRQIQESAYKFQQSIDKGQTVIVGVNWFKDEDQKGVNIQRISPSVEKGQIQQLRKFKISRNKAKVKSALSRLGSAASGDANLVEDILRAVRSECTVGEISDLFRHTFGEYRARLEI